MVQRDLMRLMPYRLTSVDFGLQAPALNFFYISDRFAEILLRRHRVLGGHFGPNSAFFAFSQGLAFQGKEVVAKRELSS